MTLVNDSLVIIVNLNQGGSVVSPLTIDLKEVFSFILRSKEKRTQGVLEEVLGKLSDIASAIVIGNLAEFEGTIPPGTLVLDTVVTSEFTFTVELVVSKVTGVRASVRESQCAVSVVETVLEVTLINNTLSLFFTNSVGEIFDEEAREFIVFFADTSFTNLSV